MDETIYLDYHATTPCDPRVVEAMLPYFTATFANPASSLHVPGRRAARAVESAREHVAEMIGASTNEIIFTSGATESNNLAIFGVAHGHSNTRRRIVTTPIEHKAVLEPLRILERQGFELVYLPIDPTGQVILEAAEEIINDQTLLVSVQVASNEIGTIQPIAEIAAIAGRHGALFHCDAAQAVGKISIDVAQWGVDLLSISAHKLYGPKGVGALYIAGGTRAQPLAPLVYGGGQEWGVRPGTSNVPGIVGLGQACLLCQSEMHEESQRTSGLRDTLEAQLKTRIPGLRINGKRGQRLPGNSSLSFPDVEADALILNLPMLALSMGSACNTGAIEPSYVLTAIGLSREMASSTVRVGLGRFSTSAEIEEAAGLITEAYFSLTKRIVPAS
ncbi:MAG TPA: cysteine desulfurase family protein [Ktedonobacterales bacterium]|nr:cysteine desulfurase family protein [Ktedonobacterales bacterium]